MARSNVITITAAALAAFTLPTSAQVQQVWVRHYDGPASRQDWGTDIVADAANNVIVTGVSQDVAQVDDIFTIKYARDGTPLWVRTFDGPVSGNDRPAAVAVDPAGNVFVVGSSDGLGSGRDFVTLAYDLVGNLLWVRRYDGPAGGDDEASDVVVDSAGRVYLTGTSAGSGTGSDLVTLAYEPTGNLLWERRYDGPASGDDGGQVIAMRGAAELVVAGFATVSGQAADFVTIAYDLAGSQRWQQTYDGPLGGEDKISGLGIDPSGNVIVTGGSEDHPGSSSFETTTIKYDSAGSSLWNRRAGVFTGSSGHRPVGVDSAGNVFVTGGNQGHVTIKLDPAGNLLWERRFSPYPWAPLGAGDAWDIAVDSTGTTYVAGAYGSSLPGGDDLDWLTLAYDANGNQVWMATYDAPPLHSWDAGLAIALDATERVLVTGLSEQTIFVPDCTTIVYETDCDCSIQAYCAAKVNSLGCTPAISMINSPSASKGWGCWLRADNLRTKQLGLFLHGSTGTQAKPFHGGFLCVGSSVRRHPPSSTGQSVGICAGTKMYVGTLSEDLNVYIAAGKDPALVPGATIYLQAWSRDPGDPFLDSLSDAVQAVICP